MSADLSPVRYAPRNDGSAEDCRCARCGAPTEWESCARCPVGEECDYCDGARGCWVCPDPAHCEALPGRESVARGLVEWYDV